MRIKSKVFWSGVISMALAASVAVPAMAVDPVVLNNAGSTTVQPIAEACEIDFETYNPGIDLQVDAGGSGGGVKGVVNYAHQESGWSYYGTEIGNASRPAKASDTTTNTYQLSDLNANAIAQDAVCVIVKNSTNMAFLDNITEAQLQAIYEAEAGITSLTWADVDLVDSVDDGWPDVNVVPRARITESGTRATFLELVEIDETMEENTIAALTGYSRLDGNQDMVDAIAANDYHIGYVGIGYITQSGIKAIPVEGVAPSEATVEDGSYPLGRFLYMYTLNPGVDSAYDTYTTEINAYLDFVMGPMGQAAVQDEGFIPVADAAPDWDINGDHGCNVGDIVAIGLHWNESVPNHPVTGLPWPKWTRANANNDLYGVNVADIVFTGNYWGDIW